MTDEKTAPEQRRAEAATKAEARKAAFEADRQRLREQSAANKNQLKQGLAKTNAKLAADLADIADQGKATDERFHAEIAASKESLRKTWADYGADRRERKEAKRHRN